MSPPQALERATVEAISFEELLGHCQATFESNQRHLDRLVEHVSNFGYEPAPAKPEETSEWESYLAQDKQQASDEASPATEPKGIAAEQGRATHQREHSTHSEQETPATHAAPASGGALYEGETPKDDNSGCLGMGGFSCAPEERATDELSIPSLGKLGLSSAAMEAIGDPHAPGSSPLWDDRSEDGDGGSDGDGDTRELYRQVISRQTPRAEPGTGRPRASEAAQQHQTQQPTTPAAAAASVPAAAASARRSAWRPQSSIRKPLSNVNYSELALQRSAVKQISAAAGAEAQAMRAVSREEFKAMPPFLTSRMTLEHLNAAVGSINEALQGKAASGLDEELSAADLEALGLGARCQSVLGCLVRMDRMELGSADGRTVYRVVDA